MPETAGVRYPGVKYNPNKYHPIDYNPYEYNPNKYNPIDYHPIEYHPIEYNPIEYNPIDYNPDEHNRSVKPHPRGRRDCSPMQQARRTARLGSEFVLTLRRVRLAMRSCQACPLRMSEAGTAPGCQPSLCANMEKLRQQLELVIQQLVDSNRDDS